MSHGKLGYLLYNTSFGIYAGNLLTEDTTLKLPSDISEARIFNHRENAESVALILKFLIGGNWLIKEVITRSDG